MFVVTAFLTLLAARSTHALEATDFLVTTDSTNISDTNQHFIARIVDPATIAVARAELGKTTGWKIVAGTIEKTAVDWNPGWSFHVLPETVILEDVFTEVCDANVEYVEENLDSAGGAFLPNNFWCPWTSRVLEEVQNVTLPDEPTVAPSVSEPPSSSPAPMATDFLVTTDFTNISNTDQHFVARIVDPSVIAEARAELDKADGWKIIAGTIDKTSVDWNPGWSFHVIPETVLFGDVFTEVCDANVEYVEENLDSAGGAFLPDNFWCPWASRVLEEIQNVTLPDEPTMSPSTSEPSSSPPPSSPPATMATEFLVTSESTNISNTNQHFVARITDPAVIEIARAELSKPDGWKVIGGTIEKTAVDWNPGWSFHLIPETIILQDVFTEVCDANVEYVEENLESAGGAFLPDNFWCPWETRVLQELRNVTLSSTEPTMSPTTVAPTSPTVGSPTTEAPTNVPTRMTIGGPTLEGSPTSGAVLFSAQMLLQCAVLLASFLVLV